MRLPISISRDFLLHLGLDASILEHWIGEERTAAICREVLETFLASFTEEGQPGEGVRVTVRAGPGQTWEVVAEGEDLVVHGLLREILGEAGIMLGEIESEG